MQFRLFLGKEAMSTQVHTEIVRLAPSSSVNSPESQKPEGRPKKRLIRRSDRDYSQSLRRTFQVAFLLMNVWLGGLFYRWVLHFEAASQTSALNRPAGVEGWLPIAGMMNFKYWLVTQQVPAMHPAAMFLLVAFVGIAFLFRKAFCSWLCPIGTVSEYLWRAGRRLLGRNFHLPRYVDIPLRGAKYLLLGFFVYAVSTMSAYAISAFMRSPYGIITDVKMLNFFRSLTGTGMLVVGGLVVASMLVQNFWCRYLCPYGALLGLASFFSPLRIRRDESACVDCGKCAKACPADLPVDKLVAIRSVECTGCLECVAACPSQAALRLALPQLLPPPQPNRRTMPTWAMAVGIAAVFFGVVGFAKTAGYWNTGVPNEVYQLLVPRAERVSHPMPGDRALTEQSHAK
jgi:polyferredoxin